MNFDQLIAALNVEIWPAVAAGTVMTLLLTALLTAVQRNRRLRSQLAERTLESDLLARSIITSRAARSASTAAASTSPPYAAQQSGSSTGAGKQLRVKIFVDGSNIVEDWRKLAPQGPTIDWNRLPKDLLTELSTRPVIGGGNTIVYCGTNVYGSYFGDDYYDLLLKMLDGKAKNMGLPFQTYKRSQIEKTVKLGTSEKEQSALQLEVDRRLRDDIADMRKENTALRRELVSLGTKFGYFPFIFERVTPQDLFRARFTADGVPIAREKRVDVQLCADLMADAAFNMYDVAVLVSCDTDFIPAIDFVRQEMRKHVVQVGHPNFSETIRKSCNDHIGLGDLIARVSSPAVGP